MIYVLITQVHLKLGSMACSCNKVWLVVLAFVVDCVIRSYAGGNADYAMDMHQKEQLHDNTVSMMQSQHFPVSPILYKLKNVCD